MPNTDTRTTNPLLATIDWGAKVAAPDGAIKVCLIKENEPYGDGGSTSLGWNAYETAQVRKVLDLFEAVSGLRFEFVDTPGQADFRLATESFRSPSFRGSMGTPGQPGAGNGLFARTGSGWDEEGGGGLERGGAGFATLLHELAHGLGFAHPHDDGGGSPIMRGVTSQDSLGDFGLNQGIYTVLSYNQGWRTGPQGGSGSLLYGWEASPMALDIALLQEKYGANLTYRTGDDVYRLPEAIGTGAFYSCIWDAGGNDTLQYDGAASAVIDLRAATLDYSATGGGVVSYAAGIHGGYTIAHGVVIENAMGGSGADAITGNDADNRLQGRGGNDRIDGGAGNDTAVFDGASAGYTWTKTADGWRVSDNRAGSPDGTDTLVGIEFLKFADRTVSLMAGPAVPAVTTGIGAVLRGEQITLETDLSARVTAGTMTEAQAIAEIVKTADQTTSVATLSYLFFTGKIPGQGGVDYLVSPTGGNPNNLNSAYYQSFNVENRYINFAVNLGKSGEGKAAFTAKYGALSLFEATREAYKAIFGAAPTDAKVHSLIDSRVDYFVSYGGDGATGIGTKAAMVGWLLAEAEKADLGVMARSNAAFLTDLADGLASKGFAIDILDPTNGYYRADFIFGG